MALGCGQLIKGVDKALLQMSVGERAKIYLSPQYACKSSDMKYLLIS